MMTRFVRFFLLVLISAGVLGVARGQSVRVKFRYQPQAAYTRVHFPGQFNNWGPNSSGTISAGTPSQADSLEASTGLWVKTVVLGFGTYQYKIYRQLSPTPTDWSWIPDPLNRVVISPDQNSQFVVDSLVLFQICAYPYTIESALSGSVLVVKTGVPRLSAGIFRPDGGPPLTITGWVDTALIVDPSASYDQLTGIFTCTPPSGLADGMHTFRLSVSVGGKSKTDSVRFEVRARPVQIQTPPFATRKAAYITAGIILKPDGSGVDSSVTSVTVSVNGSVHSAPALYGTFADSTVLVEGANHIVVSTGSGSDSVLVTRIVDHAPNAVVTSSLSGGTVTLDASGTIDPDGQTLTDFRWSDDPATPLGLAGKTGASVTVAKPASPGEYYFGLIVTDPSGYADTTRSYFVVRSDGSVKGASYADNPSWARKARVYFLFPKAASASGTLNAAAARLPLIRDLGFSVVWLMPVMKNAYPIDNNYGSGYNIVDFYTVAPEYGTNQDLKSFVDQAHQLGLKVILDITPNHTSRSHPWAINARALGQKSPYWNWYEHTIIPHNDNGLGQSLDAYGFNYYTGFSDELLNFNWKDPDAGMEMIQIFRYWIRQFGVDGYRFDVYWGPHRRYGEQYMGNPVRQALKHIKPDLLLLGEDDGTGVGTETIYADGTAGGVRGGLDAAYDFKLYFNQIRSFGFSATAVTNLHNEAWNGGFYPGPDALYMRFMETQDEDRIVYFYSNNFALDSTTTYRRTMPMASVVFTVPGFPMLWNGQEVGWGYGIGGAKEARNRSVINWSNPGKNLLSPHYQKLAHIRGEFPAFTWHKQDSNGDGAVTSEDSSDFVRLPTSQGAVYAFTRPYPDQNGMTVANFTGTDVTVSVDASAAGALNFTGGIQPSALYYVNNLFENTRQQVAGSSLDSIVVLLPPYGSAVFTISTTADTLKIAHPFVGVPDAPDVPRECVLEQNYPNPFNPATVIGYQLPAAGDVRLAVYDLLGREVAVLLDGRETPGTHTVRFEANGLSSGVYFYRLTTDGFTNTRKMVFVR